MVWSSWEKPQPREKEGPQGRPFGSAQLYDRKGQPGGTLCHVVFAQGERKQASRCAKVGSC